MLFASIAAALWAVSGISGQILFIQFHFSAAWIVSTRMIIAGSLLLMIARIKNKDALIWPFKHKTDFISIMAFSLLGMYLVQFTYFKTIELSNASFATIVQYIGPVFVIFYTTLKTKILPAKQTIYLILLALFGVTLIASKGKLENLITSPMAFLWGIGSAISLAFYSIQPRLLLEKHGSISVVGWGMFLGGIAANLIHPIWKVDGLLTPASVLQIFIVIVFGTACSFLIYLSSLNYISSALASVLTAFEPILATIFSISIFHLRLSLSEFIGFICVLGAILFLQKTL
ncbi:DMT family transporter [Enterococcus sp. 12E11_DIV0728]|uniref:DMT family transporter n=1 Tax=Enterococcus sp. 12E11_DIV0728 TaxID=1834168 RepID=UPI0034E85971